MLELTLDVDLCMTVLLKLFGSVGKTKLDNLCPQSLQRSVAQWDLGKSPLWNQLLVEHLSNHVMSKVDLLSVCLDWQLFGVVFVCTVGGIVWQWAGETRGSESEPWVLNL